MQRFLSKIAIPEDRNKCWNWTASKYDSNKTLPYGKFYFKGRMLLAHRFSFEYFNSKIPTEQMVLHKCDNASCVNPSHLFLGSQEDNMKDMSKKGRHKSPNKEKTHCRKGHEYFGDNLYIDSLGKRHCKRCRKDTQLAYKGKGVCGE